MGRRVRWTSQCPAPPLQTSSAYSDAEPRTGRDDVASKNSTKASVAKPLVKHRHTTEAIPHASAAAATTTAAAAVATRTTVTAFATAAAAAAATRVINYSSDNNSVRLQVSQRYQPLPCVRLGVMLQVVHPSCASCHLGVCCCCLVNGYWFAAFWLTRIAAEDDKFLRLLVSQSTRNV